MNSKNIRYILIVVGILDLISFYRTYQAGLWILEGIAYTRWILLLKLVLILSFPFSGVLSILGKRAGLVLYYFQFPLKLAFLITSFGFVLQILPLTAFTYRIVLGLVVGLETVRLFLTIRMHRK